jgi:RimJ/RimL family protein N-acetyltransferase
VRPYFQTSGRIGFGTWGEEDLPLASALWGDPEVTRYHGGAWSSQQIEDRLALEIATNQKWQMQYWPLFLLETGEHIGCCGRAFWSRSLGREAARAVISYGFSALPVRAIYAGHHPLNVASRNFLHHLGFRYTHDEFYPPTQLVEPCYLLEKSDSGGYSGTNAVWTTPEEVSGRDSVRS